jgi:hypothetical protein
MAHPPQTSFPQIPTTRAGSFGVYHDESGTDPEHSRFLFHGILLVPEHKASTVLSRLSAARKGYQGRIHFSQLRDRSAGDRTAATARWLDLWFEDLSYDCPHKCFAIDRGSPTFDPSKYSSHHDLYNHAAGMALTSAVAWSLNTYDRVKLSIFSEERALRPDDPFTSWLPKYLISRVAKKRYQGKVKYPQLEQPLAPVTMVFGDPARVTTDACSHCELLQLTDALTGAVAQAINASAESEVKLDFGAHVGQWIDDTRQPPWLQSKDLHRRFSVSCYPGPKNDFFDFPLKISNRRQMTLL